jgi:hypothetical protein
MKSFTREKLLFMTHSGATKGSSSCKGFKKEIRIKPEMEGWI